MYQIIILKETIDKGVQISKSTGKTTPIKFKTDSGGAAAPINNSTVVSPGGGSTAPSTSTVVATETMESKHPAFKRLLQGLSSRYLIYSDPSELLRSKQITDFERLESEILVLNYSILKVKLKD